jgi:hypothetical protein
MDVYLVLKTAAGWACPAAVADGPSFHDFDSGMGITASTRVPPSWPGATTIM